MNIYEEIDKRIKKERIKQKQFLIPDPVWGFGYICMHTLLDGLNWEQGLNYLIKLKDEGKIGVMVSPNIVKLNPSKT